MAASDDTQWVLVVDDEAAVREFVERALNYAGYAVTAVDSGHAALEALALRSYDLILTDIVMPDLDGVTLALKVAKQYPRTKVMIMTGFANQRERAHNLDFLAHDVVSKPFTLEEIGNKVRQALSGMRARA